MNDQILSQEEINALLKQSNSSHLNSDNELISIFNTLIKEVTRQIEGLLDQTINIEGPYLEKVETNLSTVFHDDILVIPIDFNNHDIFSLITSEDVTRLVKQSGVQKEKLVKLLTKNWMAGLTKVFAESTGKWAQPSLSETINLSKKQLIKMPMGSKKNLVRFNINWANSGSEVAFLMDDSFMKSLTNISSKENHETQFSSTRDRIPKKRKSKLSWTTAKELSVESVDFNKLTEEKSSSEMQHIEMVNDVKLDVFVELGRCTKTLNDLMELYVGQALTLDKLAGEPSDIYINNQPVAKAEIMVMDDNFGVRILEIVPSDERFGDV